MDITAFNTNLTFLAVFDPLILHAFALRTITRSLKGYFRYFESSGWFMTGSLIEAIPGSVDRRR